jgi:ubiquinone/menaquinone biosynthesis C-methylase UbiE
MDETQVPPSPIHFFETMNFFQRSEAMKAAIQLNVFTAIDEGKLTVPEIARRCETSERGMRILCDYLTIIEFLTKTGDRYSLTRDSQIFLSKRSPAYLGGAVDFLMNPMLKENFSNVAAAVKKGGTVAEAPFEPEDPIWVEFARSMAAVMAMPAEMIAKIAGAEKGEKWKVLDIAAGHGLFGLNIAKANPNAEIYAVDWTNVLQVASENARKMQVAERHHLIPGSAFEVSFGTGYDLVLLTNFLHHFDVTTCEGLLRKIHAALKPGGRVLTLEFIPNDDRVSPPNAAFFSMVMLVMTPAGDAYTFSELEGMFKNTGYSSSQLVPLLPGMSSLVISVK